MSTFISQIAVLAIIIIIMVVILSLFGVIRPKTKQDVRKQMEGLKKESEKEKKMGWEKKIFSADLKTEIMSFWVLEQLNSEDKVVKSFHITKIPKEGLILGIGDDCDIQLEPYKYIGHRHAVLGQDEKGMFLQDMNSTNGVYNSEQKKVQQLDVKDGVVFYLGNAKMQFRAVNPFKREPSDRNPKKTVDPTSGFEQEEAVVRVKRL